MATKRKAPYPLARNYTGEQSGKQKYLGDVKSRLMELAETDPGKVQVGMFQDQTGEVKALVMDREGEKRRIYRVPFSETTPAIRNLMIESVRDLPNIFGNSDKMRNDVINAMVQAIQAHGYTVTHHGAVASSTQRGPAAGTWSFPERKDNTLHKSDAVFKRVKHVGTFTQPLSQMPTLVTSAVTPLITTQASISLLATPNSIPALQSSVPPASAVAFSPLTPEYAPRSPAPVYASIPSLPRAFVVPVPPPPPFTASTDPLSLLEPQLSFSSILPDMPPMWSPTPIDFSTIEGFEAAASASLMQAAANAPLMPAVASAPLTLT